MRIHKAETVLIVFILALGITVGLVVKSRHDALAASYTDSAPARGRPVDEMEIAFQAAKDYVMPRLVRAVNVKWPVWAEARAHVTLKKTDQYVVVSWVESENGYGEVVRQDYTVHLTQKDGHWKVTYLRAF